MGREIEYGTLFDGCDKIKNEFVKIDVLIDLLLQESTRNKLSFERMLYVLMTKYEIESNDLWMNSMDSIRMIEYFRLHCISQCDKQDIKIPIYVIQHKNFADIMKMNLDHIVIIFKGDKVKVGIKEIISDRKYGITKKRLPIPYCYLEYNDSELKSGVEFFAADYNGNVVSINKYIDECCVFDNTLAPIYSLICDRNDYITPYASSSPEHSVRYDFLK